MAALRKRKRINARVPWNKGVEVGPREPFTPAQVSRIRALLARRGAAGRRDLALFNTAIDTMLHASDLLSLTVRQVRKRDDSIRDIVELDASGKGRAVRCTLSKATRGALDGWIKESRKKPADHLFTALTRGHSNPLTPRQLSRLVKAWAAAVGLDPAVYGTESLRRTRAIHIASETGNLEAVRVLLGHTDIGSTARYLGDFRQPDPIAVSRAHEL